MEVIKEIVVKSGVPTKFIKSLQKKIDKKINAITYVYKDDLMFTRDLALIVDLPIIDKNKLRKEDKLLLVTTIADNDDILREAISLVKPVQVVSLVKLASCKVKIDFCAVTYNGKYKLCGYGRGEKFRGMRIIWGIKS